MPDKNRANNVFSDAVCIDAGRVYDSCMDRDCLENLRVYFSEADTALLQTATGSKIRSAIVDDVLIDVEPVAFNRGFYSCDLTFYFTLTCELTTPDGTSTVTGATSYSKKVILCGSEGSVKTFASVASYCGDDPQLASGSNLPRCVVECVDPVVLESKICDAACCDERCVFPYSVLSRVGADLVAESNRAMYVTLGLFSIVQLIRNVQMMIPVYDYCIPKKQCREIEDTTPCDVFSKIKFPTEEFFPRSSLCDDECGC